MVLLIPQGSGNLFAKKNLLDINPIKSKLGLRRCVENYRDSFREANKRTSASEKS